MATTLDILIATAIGGLLLLSVINANSIVVENSTIINGDVVVQQMLISTAQIVEGEFRNMGVGVNQDSATIVQATDTSISFLSDVNRDGNIEQIDYWLGPASEMHTMQNDRIRLLHRRVSGEGIQSVGFVTKFGMRYFSQNELDTLTPPIASSDLKSIKIVEITMEVQNPSALYRDPRDVKSGQRNALYSNSYWRQTRLASQNLKR
jgi:hypothetical protein